MESKEQTAMTVLERFVIYLQCQDYRDELPTNRGEAQEAAAWLAFNLVGWPDDDRWAEALTPEELEMMESEDCPTEGQAKRLVLGEHIRALNDMPMSRAIPICPVCGGPAGPPVPDGAQKTYMCDGCEKVWNESPG